jgi:hypothetical protein
MNISEILTQEQFQRLLLNTYTRVEKSEILSVKEVLNEIIQQIDPTNLKHLPK